MIQLGYGFATLLTVTASLRPLYTQFLDPDGHFRDVFWRDPPAAQDGPPGEMAHPTERSPAQATNPGIRFQCPRVSVTGALVESS